MDGGGSKKMVWLPKRKKNISWFHSSHNKHTHTQVYFYPMHSWVIVLFVWDFQTGWPFQNRHQPTGYNGDQPIYPANSTNQQLMFQSELARVVWTEFVEGLTLSRYIKWKYSTFQRHFMYINGPPYITWNPDLHIKNMASMTHTVTHTHVCTICFQEGKI